MNSTSAVETSTQAVSAPLMAGASSAQAVPAVAARMVVKMEARGRARKMRHWSLRRWLAGPRAHATSNPIVGAS